MALIAKIFKGFDKLTSIIIKALYRLGLLRVQVQQVQLVREGQVHSYLELNPNHNIHHSSLNGSKSQLTACLATIVPVYYSSKVCKVSRSNATPGQIVEAIQICTGTSRVVDSLRKCHHYKIPNCLLLSFHLVRESLACLARI